jgi:hypothetical protein
MVRSNEDKLFVPFIPTSKLQHLMRRGLARCCVTVPEYLTAAAFATFLTATTLDLLYFIASTLALSSRIVDKEHTLYLCQLLLQPALYPPAPSACASPAEPPSQQLPVAAADVLPTALPCDALPAALPSTWPKTAAQMQGGLISGVRSELHNQP